MREFGLAQIPWREPWGTITPEYARKAEEELRHEMCAGHVLFERSVRAIGLGRGGDDVLFYLGDKPPRLAVVHLTYQQETDPNWPHTELYTTLGDWVERCMNPEADDYEA